jgi:hypothetical protein
MSFRVAIKDRCESHVTPNHVSRPPSVGNRVGDHSLIEFPRRSKFLASDDLPEVRTLPFHSGIALSNLLANPKHHSSQQLGGIDCCGATGDQSAREQAHAKSLLRLPNELWLSISPLVCGRAFGATCEGGRERRTVVQRPRIGSPRILYWVT